MATRFRQDSPPARRGKGPPLNLSERQFWLFFNARGEIGYCSEPLAQLLGRDAADVRGATVTSILPDLPVNAKTPGHNVATMTMNYVKRCHPLRLKLNDVQWLPVEAAIHSVHLGTGAVFVAELRWAGGRRPRQRLSAV